MAAAEKRLHIGGLFDTVAEDDLRQRLGKHGEVSSVEIVVRRDSEGRYLLEYTELAKLF